MEFYNNYKTKIVIMSIKRLCSSRRVGDKEKRLISVNIILKNISISLNNFTINLSMQKLLIMIFVNQ